MNIFFLDKDPRYAARWHVNKHVIKMITEYAQLLSTAHRICDGQLVVAKYGIKAKYKWQHVDPKKDSVLMKVTHEKHPSALWVRQSKENYLWLYRLYIELIHEYNYRHGKKPNSTKTELVDKIHGSSHLQLRKILKEPPKNLPSLGSVTWPTKEFQAIKNEAIRDDNCITAYRNYYCIDKQKIAEWYRIEYIKNSKNKYVPSKVLLDTPKWYVPKTINM